ncbi:hypothetical protein KAR91_45125 [Candidatus Pacearchaeota archaeon]|nr:hypothetical protein [Candidatus Pacearchaeota archaeon]
MDYQLETIHYYVKDALEEINEILKECESKTLKDDELLPLMEHALHMLNASFNLRYKSRKEINEMPQEEWEEYTLPPKEIFSGISETRT